MNRGIVYFDIDHKKEGNSDLTKVFEILEMEIPLYSQDKIRYGIGGTAFLVIGEIDKAIADYYLAIQLNEDCFEVYYRRGLLYFYKENYSLALDDFNKAIETEPEYAHLYKYRARLYRKIGDLEKSRKDSVK